ncbi:MAG: hypothetical protein Q4E39_06050 [bacterium]|nr:hypothetical protein [bacterium]
MKNKKNKNKENLKRKLLKVVLCLFYLIVISILVYSAFSIFKEEDKIISWSDVQKTDQYSKLKISQMSEAFAKLDDKQIHFVMEKESTGAWHTYLIAIKEEDYNKYKNIIDFTYERENSKPDSIEVYGYPRKIPKDIKKLAIKNITKFVPIENQVVINEKNFDKYLTNTYLDTTIEKTHEFNYYVLALLMMSFIIFIIVIYTVFEKEKDKSKRKTTIKKNKSNDNNLKSKKTVNHEKKDNNKNKEKTKVKKSKTDNTKSIESNIKESNKNTTSENNKNKDEDIEII